MQYDNTLYGAKYPLYTDNAQLNLAFYCGSQNISLQSGFTSGAYLINTNLPDSVFYWQIGADSPYSARSHLIRRGSSGSYTYNKYDGEKKNDNIPIVLVAGKPKRNAQFNFDESGSFDGNVSMHVYGFNSVSESSMRETNNTGTANWYHTDTLPVTQPTQGYFAGYPFIADFDYNNMICEILVSTSGTWQTLQDYIDNSNNATNYIRDIGVQIYAGDKSTKLSSNTRQIIRAQKYNENGVNVVNAGVCVPILTDYRYNLPDYVRDSVNYSQADYAKLCGFSSVNDGAMLFSGAVSTSSNSFYVSYLLDNDHWENRAGETKYTLKKTGTNDTYSTDDFNYIRKLIAYLGFWFTDGGNARNVLLGENALEYDENEIPTNVYQAEIKDGVTTGRFTPLSVARDNEQSKWGTDWRNKNGYNGRTAGGGQNQNRGNLNTTLNRGTIGAGCQWFALTETQLKDLISWTNSGYQPATNDQFVNDYKGTNPADYITSIMYMPFIPKTTGTSKNIFIGLLDTGVSATPLDYEYGITINVGSILMTREYNDFRDFKPYTSMSLYVPFCGTVEIDPAKFYGMYLNVKLMVDIASGSCTGLIFADDLLIDTISGQLGIKIPLSVFNMAAYQDTIVNAAYQLKSAERQKENSLIGIYAGAVIAGLTAGTGVGLIGGTAGIIYGNNKYQSAIDTINNISYDVQHTQPKQTQISSADPSNLLGMEYDCRLIITRPNDLYPDDDLYNYGHTVGYACNSQGTVSDYNGFTVCANIDTSGIQASEKELEDIRKLFKTGVYL